MAEMRRRLGGIQIIRDDLEELRGSINQPPRQRRREWTPEPMEEVGEEGEEYDSGSVRTNRVHRGRREHNLRGYEFEQIKLKIPNFQGKTDPELYLDWEKKVEQVFECHLYSDKRKIQLATYEFTEYALTWWDGLKRSRARFGIPPISTWAELKRVMKKRFVPTHYTRDLYQKLATLKQGSKGVDEYFKEMELSIIRAEIEEPEEATMARFQAGLNSEIANRLELQQHTTLEEMVHQAEKIEK